MSAIVGIHYLDGRPVCREDLQRMLDSLSHRGPDGAGHWSEGSVALGRRLLRTSTESPQECLPLVGPTRGLMLTADARLDNRDELIDLLDLKEKPADRITDSELILAAYERWGERCPEKLLGDFAFAIWDAGRRQLFCARDLFGVRPFYYHYRPRQLFAFASEMKGLFCLAEVPRRLNETMVANHMVRLSEEKEITFYRDVMRLPGGHTLTVEQDGIRVRPYWSPDLSREVRFRRPEQYAEALRHHLTEAVRCRLRGASPAGSFLSGGLDSSSIACIARNLLRERSSRSLHTFSAIFPNLPEEDASPLDERRYIEAVLDSDGFIPHFAEVDRLSPLVDLNRVLWHEDEAFFAPNLYIHWTLYGLAQQHGVRVLLDGIDGDSTVSHGLEYLAELARLGRWKALFTETSSFAKRYGGSTRRLVWEYGFRPLAPEPAVALWRSLRGRTPPLWSPSLAINQEFAQRVGLAERLRSVRAPGSFTARAVRAQHWSGLTSGLLASALELTDKAAAAFGVEPRYPFFDRRLVEFCLAVPPAQRFHRGWTRWILRLAMDGIIPPAVQWRKYKANLAPCFKRRLLECERDTLDELVSRPSSGIECFFDVSALRTAYHRYESAPIRREQDAFTLYNAVILSQWLRQAQVAVS